jgi:formate dehydrogenase subunit beta
MTTQWVLRTNGDPLATVQKLLCDIWARGELTGMLVPQRNPGTSAVTLFLAQEREHFDMVDPFAPVMMSNAAEMAAELARQQSPAFYGAVLRPCDARALFAIAKRESFRLDNFLTVGVDCLATYPAEDYEWRTRKRGNGEHLTREALQFARQGGILAYRYRQACQICTAPIPGQVDVSIGVLGLPTRQYILVTGRNEAVAHRLHLGEITDGLAPRAVIAQHDQMRKMLAERRARVRERIVGTLPATLPSDAQSLMTHLVNCAPCQACLEACPIYADELATGRSGGASVAAVNRWLASCAACGLCEDACPQHLPLSAVISRINWELLRDWITE